MDKQPIPGREPLARLIPESDLDREVLTAVLWDPLYRIVQDAIIDVAEGPPLVHAEEPPHLARYSL